MLTCRVCTCVSPGLVSAGEGETCPGFGAVLDLLPPSLSLSCHLNIITDRLWMGRPQLTTPPLTKTPIGSDGGTCELLERYWDRGRTAGHGTGVGQRT